MSNNKILFVDMDGTLVKWRPVAQMEDLLQPGYFRHLLPQTSVVQAVKLLHETGVPVYTLSACIRDCPNAVGDKNRWLDRYAPFIDQDHRLFCPTDYSKAAYIIYTKRWPEGVQSGYLLDDYTKNIQEWSASGGKAIKLLNDVNGKTGTYQLSATASVRFDDDPEKIARDIMDIMCVR